MDSFAQVSEEMEKSVAKTLSQKSSGTRSRNLGALSKIAKFWIHKSVYIPEPFRECPVSLKQKPGKKVETVPRVTLILKYVSPSIGPVNC